MRHDQNYCWAHGKYKSEGVWRTVNGAKVFIEDGEITKGPAALTGSRSPGFKKWFGDSKAVDSSGEPLVVYHGTNEEFDSFRIDKAGSQNDNGFAGEGFYFMDSKEWADGYAEVAVDDDGRGTKRVIEAYLKLENPKVIDEYEEVTNGRDIREEGVAEEISKELRAAGYDGVIVGSHPAEYVVFEPNQIKSKDSEGFDPDDDRFTKSL